MLTADKFYKQLSGWTYAGWMSQKGIPTSFPFILLQTWQWALISVSLLFLNIAVNCKDKKQYQS